MPDRVNGQLRRAQPLRDSLHARRVVVHGRRRLQRLASIRLEVQLRLLATELLDTAAREPAHGTRPLLAGGREQSELDGRAATVDRENVHSLHVQSRTSGMSSR